MTRREAGGNSKSDLALGDPPRRGGSDDGPLPPASARPETLPGGRHRLPPETVADHQHRRLIDAMASVCAERGYSAVVISDLVARAAVSKATFYRFFETKQECLFAAHKLFSASLLAAIDEACSPAEAGALRLRHGIRAALEFCASEPDGAELLTSGILSSGPEGMERYLAMSEALARRLGTRTEPNTEEPSAALASLAFAVPLRTRSIGPNPEAILALESELHEMIVAFYPPRD